MTVLVTLMGRAHCLSLRTGTCYPVASCGSRTTDSNHRLGCRGILLQYQPCIHYGVGVVDDKVLRLGGVSRFGTGSLAVILRARVRGRREGLVFGEVRRDWGLLVASSRAGLAAMVDVGENREQQQQLRNGEAARLVGEVRETYKSGRTKPKAWRMAQLKGILKMTTEREAEITEALMSDLGKPAHESFVTEMAQIQSSCKLAIRELSSWMDPKKVSGTLATIPSSSAIVSEPFGVALIISAWNFPYLLSVDPMIGAISAGCGVVLKPSEVAPATSAVLARLIPLYLDTSVIRVVEGGVPETVALLEQKWDKILYTGNPRVGRIVMAAASKNLTPVTLELGGKCPAYIDSSANLKVTLKRIAFGKWGNNNGQACIAPDYLLVDESIASEVVKVLKDTVVKFFGEDPKLSKDLSRIVNTFHYSRLSSLLDDARTSATIVHGGERDEKTLYIAPTILYDVPMDVPVMAEEIFGPVLPIIKVKGVQEAVDIINERSKPLAAYVFSNRKEVQQQMVADVSAGGMVMNDTILHFVVPGLPFGGVGESGLGSYHGKFSFDAFSHSKSVLYRNFAFDVGARYPPFTKKKKNFLKSLLIGDFIGAVLSFKD